MAYLRANIDVASWGDLARETKITWWTLQRFCKKHGIEKSESTPVARFWKYAEASSDGCWRWRGGVDPHGYPVLVTPIGKFAHRFSYWLHYGHLPKDLHVCHACDNPPCCNPNHLFLGTQAANLADASRKGRLRHGSGHPRARLSEADVLRMVDMRAQGSLHREMAQVFGVSRKTVGDILSGRYWRHVPR